MQKNGKLKKRNWVHSNKLISLQTSTKKQNDLISDHNHIIRPVCIRIIWILQLGLGSFLGLHLHVIIVNLEQVGGYHEVIWEVSRKLSNEARIYNLRRTYPIKCTCFYLAFIDWFFFTWSRSANVKARQIWQTYIHSLCSSPSSTSKATIWHINVFKPGLHLNRFFSTRSQSL